MRSKRAVPPLNPPGSPVPQHVSDAEMWEPPFERWLKLADDLLQKWPISKLPVVGVPTARS